MVVGKGLEAHMKANPIQQAVDFLRGGDGTEQRTFAIRTAADGEFTIKTYLDSRPGPEVVIGGKRDLNEALSSIT